MILEIDSEIDTGQDGMELLMFMLKTKKEMCSCVSMNDVRFVHSFYFLINLNHARTAIGGDFCSSYLKMQMQDGIFR